MNWVWIIVAVVVIGLVIWYFSKQKGGPSLPKKPEGPGTPPPPPPSETPGM